MRLGELLRGIVAEKAYQSHAERNVSGVFGDSRAVRPDGVFVVVRGADTDGRRFVDDALRRGAAVLIGEDLGPVNGAIALNVPDARAALGQLALRWNNLDFQKPDAMKLLGVTGTNGKTTTAFMTRAILRAAGQRCGMFGTVHYDLCLRTVTASMTTPGALELAGYLKECADAGARATVMEVSSHALDQKRVEGLRFAAAAFTNLTGDHLDYHKTFENYRAAKAKLFQGLDENAVAIVNRDDPSHEDMVRGCRAKVMRYSLQQDADITATISKTSVKGTFYRLRIDGRDLVLENAIPGKHNVYNALAAAGLTYAIGIPLQAISAGLMSVRNIPGRLQRVPCVSGADVFVDYAHTDDALRNVLNVLKPLTRRKLIVVFGCGGDRDRTKRPRMAKAVAEFADAIFVTSDNPRTEEPRAIIDEILTGFDAAARLGVQVEPDRRQAIQSALADADEGDVVLIAGKGHEDYQIIGTRKIHFDDVEAAIEAAAKLAKSGKEVG